MDDREIGLKELVIAFFSAFAIGAAIIAVYALIWGKWFALQICATVFVTIIIVFAFWFFADTKEKSNDELLK